MHTKCIIGQSCTVSVIIFLDHQRNGKNSIPFIETDNTDSVRKVHIANPKIPKNKYWK